MSKKEMKTTGVHTHVYTVRNIFIIYFLGFFTVESRRGIDITFW